MKLRIVVIDDEVCIRESLEMYLTELGYEVLTAETPSFCPVFRGCDCDQTHPCADILFIDQNMPHIDGLDYIKEQLRRGCKAPAANKVIMSGVVTPELAAEGAELGCQVMQKPFSFKQVETMINEMAARLAPDRKFRNFDE